MYFNETTMAEPCILMKQQWLNHEPCILMKQQWLNTYFKETTMAEPFFYEF